MISVILNRSAGSGEAQGEISRELARVFGKLGVEFQIERPAGEESPVDVARRVAAGPARILAAGGGDGTINAVASAVVGTDKLLGVLPLGTLNHFAKDLGIPLKLEGAARVLVEGKETVVDVGEVNGSIFLNNSSIGVYPEIVRRREKEQQVFNRGKWRAFVKASATVMESYQPLRVTIARPEREITRETPFVFIGNNRYVLDGFGIGGRDRIDRGELCCYFAQRPDRSSLIRLGWRGMMGRLRGDRDFDEFTAHEFEIRPAEPEIRVATDGEITLMKSPLRYRVRPRALRVMIPR